MFNRILFFSVTFSLGISASLPDATQAQSACHPSYENVCLPLNGPDVDCAGGGGNGPLFVEGPVRVIGPDPYRLDRDKDGIACEKK
jgi:hypothetical protein